MGGGWKWLHRQNTTIEWLFKLLFHTLKLSIDTWRFAQVPRWDLHILLDCGFMCVDVYSTFCNLAARCALYCIELLFWSYSAHVIIVSSLISLRSIYQLYIELHCRDYAFMIWSQLKGLLKSDSRWFVWAKTQCVVYSHAIGVDQRNAVEFRACFFFHTEISRNTYIFERWYNIKNKSVCWS